MHFSAFLSRCSRRPLASDEIRAALAAARTPFGRYDVLIAGQSKARDLTLVTDNASEFHRVVGLRVGEWTV